MYYVLYRSIYIDPWWSMSLWSILQCFSGPKNPLALLRGNTRSTQPTRWWQHPLMFCWCKGHRMPWTGTLNPCWADLKWSKSKVCFVPPVQISKNDEPSSGFRNYLGQFRALSRIYGNRPKKQLMNPEWHPQSFQELPAGNLVPP